MASSRTLQLAAACACLCSLAHAQGLPPGMLEPLRWRMIGPFRGGRTVAATGVPGRPNEFLIGVNNGGVWKTTDYGRVWTPIFDDQPTGSIGAIAVAPSRPDMIYVGSGEGLQRPDLSTGDGIYKSSDGGRTWQHLGLRDAQQIAAIIVDPHEPDRLFVAALGHPYGPNDERGIFRSLDGGHSFTRVLYRDADTGAFDVAFDPGDARIVYAVLWAGRQAPWEIGSSFDGPGSGLFKSEDGGATWRQLERGLPTWADRLGRIGLGLAPSDARRIYATVDSPTQGGLYRSDDAGESWQRINADGRLWGRGSDFAEVKVDPRNPEIVYVANVVTWKSTDGGKTFTAFRGAPGGDDYHRLWISGENSNVILLASDQGAIITVNGGATFSSWYNQPTAQFYHVITDNRFPYRVYGGQQESGSVGIVSRGDDGQITFREWHPVGVEEYGYVAPDPLDPDIVYGGKLTRFDWRTGEVQNVAPVMLRARDYRTVRTLPVIFSPVDPHVLYFASNVVWRTRSGGQSWEQISPDLSRAAPAVPKNLGVFTDLDPEHGKHRGVIYTLAPSPLDQELLWAGTDDGLIHVTRDGGKTWQDVTPPVLEPWCKVSLMEASHFERDTAYAAINTFRRDELHPHVLRTRDGGQTWDEIVNGMRDGAIVNVVREDPVRRGLLFAGSETEVWVSFDAGEHWQSLRRNMPATSIRDLVIHDADLVVGTHGRSFFIMDDITPLRTLDAATAGRPLSLLAPHPAHRVRWNRNTDTPLPQEEPAGENPPDGAILDYFLGAAPSGPLVLEIHDEQGALVRRFRSDDPPEPLVAGRNIPDYWIRPPQTLSAAAGMHRFVWDLHYPPPRVASFGYPIAAIYRNTPREPLGPWVLPGRYRITLAADQQSETQSLAVQMDPRIHAAEAVLEEQLAISLRICAAIDRTATLLAAARSLRPQIDQLKASVPADLKTAVADLSEQLATLVDGTGGDAARGVARTSQELARLLELVQQVDAGPTTPLRSAIDEVSRALEAALARWDELIEKQVPALNAALASAGLASIKQ